MNFDACPGLQSDFDVQQPLGARKMTEVPWQISAIRPYRDRHISYLNLANIFGWRLKLYGVSVSEFGVSMNAQAAVVHLAERILPVPPLWPTKPDQETPSFEARYGVGFGIAHEAADGLYALISWWVGENMLQHHVYYAETGKPEDFKSIAETGVIACVWEMQVMAFERNAWVRDVLANPNESSLERYLCDIFQQETLN
jgi:hypothetical protein